MRDRLFGSDHEGSRLSAFLDDELSETDALEVTRHLDHCEECLTELTEIRLARSALRGLPSLRAPEQVFAFDADAGPAHDGRARSATMLAVGAAAALLVLGFLVGGRGDDGTVVPPVDHFVADHVARTGGGPVLAPVDLGSTGR